MKTFLSFVILLIGGCSAAPPTARNTDEEPRRVPVAKSFRHVLHSDTIGQDFLIDVSLPYVVPDEPMPVVYVTDGNTMFKLVTYTTRTLQLGRELPPMIVVGIGYVVTPTAGVLALRTRDLTPTLDATFEESLRETPVPELMAMMALPEGMETGGAAAFLDFIETDVKPFIAANYPAMKDDSTLVGDSLGGLEEDSEKPEDDSKMVTNARMMASQLEDRGYPNLRLTFHVFEDETHLSVIPATISCGLRDVFANDVALPSDH